MTALKTSALVTPDQTLTVTLPQCGMSAGRYDVVITVAPFNPAAPSARAMPPDLNEYRRILAAARGQAPPSPWQTTAEAMEYLREGEKE